MEDNLPYIIHEIVKDMFKTYPQGAKRSFTNMADTSDDIWLTFDDCIKIFEQAKSFDELYKIFEQYHHEGASFFGFLTRSKRFQHEFRHLLSHYTHPMYEHEDADMEYGKYWDKALATLHSTGLDDNDKDVLSI